MNINKILLIMDMENGDCTKLIGKILDVVNNFKASLDVLVVLESVKKIENIATSFGMPFDPYMKENSIKQATYRLKHLFPKDMNVNFHVKVGDFDEEAETVYKEVNPDMILLACNNFNKDISKLSKSTGKPILLIN
jgi:hypothetical protein